MIRRAEFFQIDGCTRKSGWCAACPTRRIRRGCGANEQRFDFCDLPALHFETKCYCCRDAFRAASLFTHGSDECDLSCFRIAHKQTIRALSRDGLPMRIANIEPHSVLREFDASRERQHFRIVGNDSIEIQINESFQARSIASAALCPPMNIRSCRKQ